MIHESSTAHRRHLVGVLLLTWAMAVPCVGQAEDVLDYLPEDALGFVLIRDLAGTSEQCEQLLQMFEMDVPAPLAFVKLTTGLGTGLNLEGDALAALLPGVQVTDPPEPLVVLSVADYAQFAASINADDSGEVCRVTIAGEDVLVARHGPYAMLMNVENRETLEILIGLEPAPVALVQPWAAWLQDNEATIAILPPGVKKLLEMGRRGLARQHQQWGQEFGDPEFSEALGQMQQSLTIYHTMLDLFGTKINAAAVGFSLSESKDLRLGLRFLLASDLVDSTETVDVPAVAPLAGYPDQPFVCAGGGPTSSAMMRAVTSASVLLMKQSPEAYGYQGFDDQAWQELEESYLELSENVHSATVLMLTGEKGDPLFGNFYGISVVDNASEYLATYKRAVETWNRLAAQSANDIKMQYEVHDTKVGGAEACEVVVDVAAAARDPNVPMFNWMLESLFGKEGKLRMLLVAADEKTLIVGLADEARMATAIEQLKRQERGLQDSAAVQTTEKLLDSHAAWKFYVSPRGCVAWFQRVMDELFGQIVQQTMQFPEYAPGPPVGISVHAHGARTDVDIVWPAPSLESLADFVKECREL